MYGIFTYIWHEFYGFHVRKYTSPMDPMGLVINPNPALLVTRGSTHHQPIQFRRGLLKKTLEWEMSLSSMVRWQLLRACLTCYDYPCSDRSMGFFWC